MSTFAWNLIIIFSLSANPTVPLSITGTYLSRGACEDAAIALLNNYMDSGLFVVHGWNCINNF
jgi:hypothetical protein